MKLINCLLFLSIVLGAEIQLIDGNTINGEIISDLNNKITIKTPYSDDLIEIDKSKVLNVSFDSNYYKSSISKGETTQSINKRDIEEAGKYLKKFRGLYYFGAASQVVGYLLLSADLSDGYNDSGAVPSMLILAGFLAQFASINNVGHAGDSLEKSVE
tara:strand:- start:256 stop:729 length:474 start_codon:yes stop_codon:yes gene_type:complete